MPRGPRPRRPALLLGLLVLPLAACRADVSVRVALGASGGGTVVATVILDRQAAAALGAGLDTRDLRRDGWTVVGPALSPDGSENVAVSHAFRTPADAAVLLGRLGAPFQLRVTHRHGLTSSSVGVRGAVDLRAGLDALAGAATALPGGLAASAGAVARAGGVTPSVSAQVVVALPGRPVGVVGGGTVRGDTVTWEVPLGASAAIGATAARTDTGAELWLAAAAVCLAALAAVVSVQAVVAGRRRTRWWGVGVTPPP